MKTMTYELICLPTAIKSGWNWEIQLIHKYMWPMVIMFSILDEGQGESHPCGICGQEENKLLGLGSLPNQLTTAVCRFCALNFI